MMTTLSFVDPTEKATRIFVFLNVLVLNWLAMESAHAISMVSVSLRVLALGPFAAL